MHNAGAERWFGRHRLGNVPIGPNRAYVFHVMRNDNDNQTHLEWLQERQALGQFSALDFRDAHWLSHPLHERVIDWGAGNRVAIRDAWTLAELIRRGDTSTPYSVQLSTRRHARVQSIQRQSWQFGNKAHLPPRPLRSLRNALIKLMPPSLMLHQQRRLMLAYTTRMETLVA